MVRTRSATRHAPPSQALLSRLLSLPDELLEAVVRSLLDANDVLSLLRLGQACKDLVSRLALVRAEAEAARRLQCGHVGCRHPRRGAHDARNINQCRR